MIYSTSGTPSGTLATFTTDCSGADPADVSRIEVIEENAANGDFILKTVAANGCDSIVRLHIDYDVVQRDTIIGHVLYDPAAITPHLFCQSTTIGNLQEGDMSQAYLPIYPQVPNFYSQHIFTQAEVGNAGTISSISFLYFGEEVMTAKNDVKMYLGHTTKSEFASDDST